MPKPTKGGNLVKIMAVEAAAAAFWIVVMINVRPQDFERRAIIRSTLAAQLSNATVLPAGVKHPLTLKISYYFAVGVPSPHLPKKERQALRDELGIETEKHGDIAHLVSISDGILDPAIRLHCRQCKAADSGKSHHLFSWAHARFNGKAHAIFKQDDDTFVDWSVAAGRMFNNMSFPPTRAVFGYAHHAPLYAGGNECPAGSLYGYSMEVVEFFVTHFKARTAFEDKEACHWLEAYERVRGDKKSSGLGPQVDPDAGWVRRAAHKDTDVARPVDRQGLIHKVENLNKDYLTHGGRMKDANNYASCITCAGCGGKDNWFFVQHKYVGNPCLDMKKYKHKRRPEAMRGT